MGMFRLSRNYRTLLHDDALEKLLPCKRSHAPEVAIKWHRTLLNGLVKRINGVLECQIRSSALKHLLRQYICGLNCLVRFSVAGSTLGVLHDPRLHEVRGHHYILQAALKCLLLLPHLAHPIRDHLPPAAQRSLHGEESVDLSLADWAQRGGIGIGHVNELSDGIALVDLSGVFGGWGARGKLGRGRESVGGWGGGGGGGGVDARERGGRDRRGRGRGWGIGAPGEEGRVEAEQVREGSDEIDEVGGGENPRAEVRGVGDEAGAVDEGVVGLDDHVACWGEEDEGRRPRVGLREPEDSGEVVGGAGVVDGDGAVGLEEVGGAAVVVGEEGGLGVERGESVGEGDEVVADQPLHVLRVGQGGGPALGERRVQELVRVLRAARRRWGRRRRWRGHRSRSPPLGVI
ncbi:Os02g0833250 [Oryza sativa Japonica Group]|uniref:Os02g0833250 protein n=1 Tax=Oryza sativa subsp. japonica TaxID=39947 RepID=C7IZ96_ORYSJ|nr:Os02g0833250 [Oryza sativa Japonica Group]|eukprot:NP_001173222.1 Os02g0833250 [Oryza sativa Japonica Group]